MIGPEEVRHALAAEGGMHVTCEFCGQRYAVTREEAERALADAAGKTPQRAV
jgi:redox-regulated HSP33 family molecular chaperone